MPTEKLNRDLVLQAVKLTRLQQAFNNLAQSPEMEAFLNL